MTDSTVDINTQAQETLAGLIMGRTPERLGEVFAENVVDHDPAPDQAPGSAGIVAFWTGMLTAFPDLELTPEVLSAEGDHVTVVLTITGTNTGEFEGAAPTGKSISVRGIQIARFEDGKIVERWGSTDQAGLAAQLAG
jgi:predicted ester cyclase